MTAGAQSGNKDRQAFAFLPNELWIHAGDSVTWRIDSDEMHTVTFLKPGGTRPAFQAGCPGSTPDGSPFNASACVNSGTLSTGQTYSVSFPATGNFKLVCLVHPDMTGTIHVLDFQSILPHDQRFYDAEAESRRSQLLELSSRLLPSRRSREDDAPSPGDSQSVVTAGVGRILATPGGSETVSIVRFLQPAVMVRVGDTVEWQNFDPVAPHTITFGTEPANPNPSSSNVTVDPDGAKHATIGSASDSVNSGFIVAAPQDRIGLAQAAPGVTRFRVTFTTAGTFYGLRVEEFERGVTYLQSGPGNLPLVDEMQLVVTDLIRPQTVWRQVEVAGEIRHGLDVRVDRQLGVVPKPKIFRHALTQCRHERVPFTRSLFTSTLRAEIPLPR